MRSFLKKLFKDDKFSFKILFLWVIIISILYSLLSILRHVRFESGGFDLGIFDQVIWKYAHFLSPYSTIKERFILGDHLNLTLPLLAPLYWIWEDVKILLIFQAVFISFSTIAIYKTARLRNFSSFVSLCLSFIYSTFWGIQFAVYFDFHPIIIGVGLLAWFIYFFEAKIWNFFWIFLILMLLTQENMGIALSSIGFVYLFKKGYRKIAVAFIVGGIVIGLASVKVISLMSPVGYEYFPSFDLNPFHLITKFIDNSDKRLVLFYSFSWFSFVPIFSPGAIFAVVLDLSQYFLPLKQFGHMITPFLHERAILAPIITLGLFDALEFLKKKGINLVFLSIVLVLSVLLQQFIFHFPLNKLSKSAYWKRESWMEDNEKLFKEIPKKLSIAAAQNLAPHLSQRKEIYLLYPRIKDFPSCMGCFWLEFAGKPEYIVLDLHYGQTATQLLESTENFSMAVRNMENAKKIKKISNINNIYIYKINY